MKKLLLLSDFTANSDHAATIALRLCEKLKSDLLLYHSVQYVPFVTDYTYGSVITETADTLFKESKERLNKEAESLQPLTIHMPGYHPQITSESGAGNLGANIKVISGRDDISLIVMGGRTGSTLDHLLTGSETAAVINNIRKPVLVIPEKADLQELNKVIFATDFSTADIQAIDFLMDMAHLLDFQIEAVHIIKHGANAIGIEKEVACRKYLSNLDQQIISYKLISGNHIVPRLQDYCKETGANLLVMTHGHYNVISRLFTHSDTKEVLAHQQVAVMIIPED